MNNQKSKIRTAVYIRIGGTGEFALHYDVQMRYFTEMIKKNPDWELAGFYADLGAESRSQPNLKRLIADCKAGRIDLIITKSVARISRSVVNLMKIIRELAYLNPPVGVYFEDTGINTVSRDGYMFLSMFEAMGIEAKNDRAAYNMIAKHIKTRDELKPGEEDNDELRY